MRRFKVRVNDEVFEVEVEELGQLDRGRATVAATPLAPAVAPRVSAPKPALPVAGPVTGQAQPATPAVKEDRNTGNVVRAPIPGVVSEVRVSSGAKVKQGDVLILLEAMKMQNEILAPQDAVIAEVTVAPGASVQTGDVLVKF